MKQPNVGFLNSLITGWVRHFQLITELFQLFKKIFQSILFTFFTIITSKCDFFKYQING
jgi:hypothetical protein